MNRVAKQLDYEQKRKWCRRNQPPYMSCLRRRSFPRRKEWRRCPRQQSVAKSVARDATNAFGAASRQPFRQPVRRRRRRTQERTWHEKPQGNTLRTIRYKRGPRLVSTLGDRRPSYANDGTADLGLSERAANCGSFQSEDFREDASNGKRPPRQ